MATVKTKITVTKTTPAKAPAPAPAEEPVAMEAEPAAATAPAPAKKGKAKSKSKGSQEKKKKRRRAYDVMDPVFGTRPFVTRKTVFTAVNAVRQGMSVSKKFVEFMNHFLRHKAVEIIRAAEEIVKIRGRRRVYPREVLSAIKSVMRGQGEEAVGETAYESQMLDAASKSAASYAKALAAKVVAAEQRGPRVVKAKLKAVRRGVVVPYPLVKKVAPEAVSILTTELKEAAKKSKTAASRADAKSEKLATAVEDQASEHTVAPTASLGWADATEAAGLCISAVRIYNLASEVCSDAVSFTKPGTMALAGALNYLLVDIVDGALEQVGKKQSTLLYSHLESALFSVNKSGVEMLDEEAYKLLEPYTMRTSRSRKLAVGMTEPVWNYLTDMFHTESTKELRFKSKKEAKAYAEARAAAEEKGVPFVWVPPERKKARKSAPQPA